MCDSQKCDCSELFVDSITTQKRFLQARHIAGDLIPKLILLPVQISEGWRCIYFFIIQTSV